MLKKLMLWFFIFGLFFCLSTSKLVVADELGDITAQIAEVSRLLSESQKATKPLEENIQKIQTDIQNIENNILVVEKQILVKEEEISKGEKDLVSEKKKIDERARGYYKESRGFMNNFLAIFLSKNLTEASRAYFYQQQGIYKNRQFILRIAFFVRALEEKKVDLEESKTSLAAAKIELAKQKVFFDTEVGKAKQYQGELQSKIAELSAKQQQIIAAKEASLGIPRSAGTSTRGCSSDLTNGKEPGFSPRIGFFTYGAPHRNGLNQYGAWGRARAGQNEEQILQIYYPNMSLKKDYDQGAQITTTTGWSGSIEEYVKRIYEVPDSWTDNNLAVLKAQAVAARTYALNSAQRNGAICTTESCQVFKPDPKGGNWEQAVNATAGWVLMDGGNPGFTQYASTHGGYVLNLGKFDGDGGNPTSFVELNERAYDKESPWFYCNWGTRSEYAGTAWLKPSEVADIFNVIALARADSGTKDKLYQPDKPHPYGGDVWNPDRVRQELKNRGGSPVESVVDISIGVDFTSGKTISISGGGITATGDEFKDWFNLRAPANIQIVGPLYNVEKR